MQPARLIDLPDPEWLALVRAEVGKGRSIAAVSAELGLSRPGLSMLLSGKYGAKIDKISGRCAALATRLYAERVLCPHLRRGIPHDDCRSNAAAPMSTHDPDRLAQWAACRRCPLNPVKKPEEKQ